VPTYDYECEKCHKTFEVEQKISDPPLKTCVLIVGLTTVKPLDVDQSKCGGPVKRLISGPSAFVLKGGGWAKDGY